jgi:hypothetical protein
MDAALSTGTELLTGIPSQRTSTVEAAEPVAGCQCRDCQNARFV